MFLGIVGAGADKFTPAGEAKAKTVIRSLFMTFISDNPILVSGHSPIGGIDIWTEETAKELGCYSKDHIKEPKQLCWNAEYGYKQRNLDIAKESDVLYVIVVDKYPPNYKGKLFKSCYHCHKTDHIKSGACWTAKRFEEIHNKTAVWLIVGND